MTGYYSAQRIVELNQGRAEAGQQLNSFREAYCFRTYKSDRAAEYARHGFCRRLEMLVHTINKVYETLPPDREDIPERDEVIAAAAAIHAFVMNAFGCLDNLAWIWVYEKNVKWKNGTELEPVDVGLRAAPAPASSSPILRTTFIWTAPGNCAP